MGREREKSENIEFFRTHGAQGGLEAMRIHFTHTQTHCHKQKLNESSETDRKATKVSVSGMGETEPDRLGHSLTPCCFFIFVLLPPPIVEYSPVYCCGPDCEC